MSTSGRTPRPQGAEDGANKKASPTFADWEKLAARELKDTPVESLNRDYGGVDVRPAYFAEDASDPGLPGVAPFTRGVRATMYANRPWTIRQYAGFSTARESNAFYRQNLAGGAEGPERRLRSGDASRL